MPSRNLLIGMIAASLTSGVAVGMSTPTGMTMAPEPEWRAAWHAAKASVPQYRSVDSGPVDLSPAISVASIRVADWQERQTALAIASADLGPRSVAYREHRPDVEPLLESEQTHALADTGLQSVPDRQAIAGDSIATAKSEPSEPMALTEPANVTSGESFSR